MAKLLEIRSLLRAYYQKFQMAVDPVVKFLAAFITFRMINTSLGYDARLEKFVVVFLMSLLCAFTPPSILVFLALVVSVLHVYSVSPMLALIVLLVFMILYCFFLRFAPQYGYVVVAIPILFTLKMPYLVPILMGLLANPITILPSSCGVIVYYLFQIIKEHADTNAAVSLDDVLPLYTEVFEAVLGCRQILIFSGVFAVVIITVYIVRKLKMEYASEIAILAGAVVNVFGFLFCDLKFGISGEIGSMILGTILSVLAAAVALFFKRVLDYTAVENVQFEDDDYYYYVKAVPKLEIGVQERKIKHINEKNSVPEEEEDEDDYEEILNEETGEVFFRPKKGQGTGSQVRMQKGGRNAGYLHRRLNESRTAKTAENKEYQSFEQERQAARRYEAGAEDSYLGEEELLRADARRTGNSETAENSGEQQ